jgi:hypothetical protein
LKYYLDLGPYSQALLEIEAAKKQDEILENIKITRSAITIDDEDEEITIDDLPPFSTAPVALGGGSKRARAGIIDYRALAELSRTREKIERLNREAERKKKAKAAEMALRSPVKKKSRFIDAKAFERKVITKFNTIYYGYISYLGSFNGFNYI